MPRTWTPPPPATIEECHRAFDAALVSPTYGTGHSRWPAYVNEDILIVFGEDSALGREAFVPRYDARMATKFANRRGERPQPDRRAWESAGNAVGWGLRLGLLTAETGPDGARAWRLVRREPTYILDKKWQCEQVAGLTSALQAARDKRAATQAKLTATLARKACEKKSPWLAQRLRWILEDEPGFAIPASWAAQGYVPEWTVGTALSACFDTIRDAPIALEFSKGRLAAWDRQLAGDGILARHRASERRLAAQAEAADVPAEDAAALEDLL
ncbi:hypothetical protein D8770_14300 [Methylobacterium sp. DB1607]|nr:hypothetical protein [Methylobacterium sp. DB1607]